MSLIKRKTLKKAISTVTAITTVVWLSGVSMLAMPSMATAAIADGALIKSNATNSDETPTLESLDVYIVKVVGTKKFKRLILNPTVFNSYGHLNWGDIQTVSQAVMDGYTTSSLVRVDTDPDEKVYAMAPDGDIGSKSWVNLSATDFLGVTGSDADSIYTINATDGGNYNAVADVTTTAELETFYTDGTLPGVSETGTGLTVALASDTPASATVPTGASLVKFTKVNFAAASDGDVKIKNLVVKRIGVGSSSDLGGVYIYDGDTRLTNARTISSTTDKATFNGINVTIPAGETKTLSIVSSASGESGNHGFSIDSADDITTDGAAVSGSFPVSGNEMTLSAVVAGALTYTLQGVANATLKVGDKQQEVAKIKIAEDAALGTEDINVRSITFTNDGSADANDLKNFKLYRGSDLVAELESSDSDRVAMVLDTPLTIKQGGNKTFTLKADIMGGVGAGSIIYDIDDATDLVAVGATYGYGVGVSVDAASNTSSITVEAGELTIEVDGPAAYEVTDDANDVVLANLTITTGGDEDVEIKNLYGYIAGTEATPDANLDTGIENVQLVNVDTGDIYDVTKDDAVANDKYFFKVSNFTVPAGESKWEVQADMINTVVADGDIFKFVMFAGDNTSTLGTYPTGSTSAKKGVEAENQSGKALDDIKPGSEISGNNVTIATASLAVAAVTLNSGTAVARTKDVKLAEFTAEAGNSEAIKITQVTAEIGSGTGDYLDASNYSLYVEGETDPIEEGVSAVNATPDTVTFNSITGGGYTIPAGETKTFYITGDIASSDLSSTMRLDLTADGITAEDTDGDSMTNITGLDSALTGRTVALSDKGSIVFTVDSDSPSAAHAVLSGSTDNEVLKVKADASDEDIVIKTLEFRNLGSTNTEGAQATGDASVENTITLTSVPYGTIYNGYVYTLTDGGSVDCTTAAALAGATVWTGGATKTIVTTCDLSNHSINTAELIAGLNHADCPMHGRVTASQLGTGAGAPADSLNATLTGGVSYGVPNETYAKSTDDTMTYTIAGTWATGDTATAVIDGVTITVTAAADPSVTSVALLLNNAINAETGLGVNTGVAIKDLVTASPAAGVVTLTVSDIAKTVYGEITTAASKVSTSGANTASAESVGGGANRTDTDRSIAKVALYQDGTLVKEKTTITSAGYIEFTNLDTLAKPVVVSKDTDSIFTLKVNSAGIGTGSNDTATSGDALKLALEGSNFVAARGYSSNNDLTAANITVTSVESQNLSIYGSKVIATDPGSQASILASGQKEILKFTLTPTTNNSKTAQLAGLNITIDLTDNNGSGLGIQDSGSTSAIEVYSGSTQVAHYSTTTLDTNSGLKTLTMDNTTDDISSAGETYVVKVNAVGVAADDSITASIGINGGAGNDDITWNDYATADGGLSVQWIDLGEGSSITSISNTINK